MSVCLILLLWQIYAIYNNGSSQLLSPKNGYTGEVRPPFILSGSSPKIKLEFDTNAAVGDLGFRAVYSVG